MTSTKVIFIWSLLGTLGIASLAKATYVKPPSPVAIMPQHHSRAQMLRSQGENGKLNSVNNASIEVTKSP